MNACTAPPAEVTAANRPNAARLILRNALWPLLIAAAGIPLSLLWDYSWESTVGIDRVWSAPHTATYLAVALTGLTALSVLLVSTKPNGRKSGVRIGACEAPLGIWVVAWGAAAFLSAALFDRWWQLAYGLGAGIWHPPQICKAVAFFTVLLGVWLFCLHEQNTAAEAAAPALAFAAAGGLIMAMITVVTLVGIYPNRQHSTAFYQVACGTYPLVLAALVAAGKSLRPATVAALVYMAVICAMVWLLPLFPARPQVSPIYNPRDHLMPPPFPLLLVVPAFAVDALFRQFSWPEHRLRGWFQAMAAGLMFFLLFTGAQWIFAEVLLTQEADNWLLAGGGHHWPFFLKISPEARRSFWETPQNELTFGRALCALGLAVVAARLGLRLGAWMKRLQR